MTELQQYIAEAPLVDTHEHLLAYLDTDIQQILESDLHGMGIQLHMQTRIEKIERDGNRVRVRTDTGSELEADILLYALGREPNYDNLNLKSAGLSADDHGWVRINEHHQTTQHGDTQPFCSPQTDG